MQLVSLVAQLSRIVATGNQLHISFEISATGLVSCTILLDMGNYINQSHISQICTAGFVYLRNVQLQVQPYSIRVGLFHKKCATNNWFSIKIAFFSKKNVQLQPVFDTSCIFINKCATRNQYLT